MEISRPTDLEALQGSTGGTAALLDRRHCALGRNDPRAKRAAEDAAIERLAGGLTAGRGEMLRTRWAELRERTTAEARFVKEMDVLETWLQSRRYLGRYPEAPMQSFELEARELLGNWIADE